jgi:hypothetical protein
MGNRDILVVWLLTVAVVVPVAWADPAADLLEKGVYQEEVAGNLSGAIKLYQQIISDVESSRPAVAEALYRKAACHQRLGEQDPARATLRQLIARYPDQIELVKRAHEMLDEQLRLDPATVMPPQTMVYIEIGDPGRQVQVLAAMLAGTPYANPLAALQPSSAPAGTAPAAGQKSSRDMARALFNPSMITEFEKVRGLAIGFGGLEERGGSQLTRFVAVLQPGESDALRGLIQAMIGMAGEPMQPIEGMTAVTLQGQAACAYDDNVFLFACPPEEIIPCVRRYKGLDQGTSLASDPTFRAQTAAADRHKDTMTLWLQPSNVKNLLEGLGMRNDKFDVIAALMDLPNVQGIVLRGVLDPRQPHLSASMFLQEGHRCVPYNALRTQPMSMEGLRGVPADAVAIAVVSLAGRDDAAMAALRGPGSADLSRELLASVDQVCLFVVPLDQAANAPASKGIGTLNRNMGLVLTSDDPQRTLVLIEEAMGAMAAATSQPAAHQAAVAAPAADPVAKAAPAVPVDTSAGLRHYVVNRPGQTPIELFLGQQGQSTVVAFHPSVAQRSLDALRSGKSVLNEGPLKAGLASLPPQSSKVVLVNAGAMLGVLDQQLDLSARVSSALPEGSASLAQVAEELKQTLLVLHTQEAPNRLDVYLGLDNLPAMDKLLPSVQAYARAMQQVVRARQPSTRSAVRSWTGGAGQWDAAGNWSDGQTPKRDEEVRIGGEGAHVTIASGKAHGLRVYVGGPTTATLTIAPAGRLELRQKDSMLKVGFGAGTSGNGLCVQEGIVLANRREVVVGDGSMIYNAQTTGLYELRSGMLVCDNLRVGIRAGHGTLNQSNGSAEVGTLSVGDVERGVGACRLTGGMMIVQALNIQSGVLDLAGGTIHVSGPMVCGADGTLRVTVAGLPDQPRLADIAGNVRLVPGSTLELSGDLAGPAGEYTILSVLPGYRISGGFTNVPAGWTATLMDGNTRLVLTRQGPREADGRASSAGQ